MSLEIYKSLRFSIQSQTSNTEQVKSYQHQHSLHYKYSKISAKSPTMHIPQAIVPLALSAYTAVTKTFDAATVRHTAPANTLAETTVDQFNDNHCGQYVNTIFVPNNGKNGGCNQVDGTKSIRVTGVEGGCSGKHVASYLMGRSLTCC